MVGSSSGGQLDRLIDEVARRQRHLSSIQDPELRESVRIALRLHAEAPSVPDAYTKARMRVRIMARLDPRARTLADTAWSILELLARPAPFIVRGIGLTCIALCIALAGFVASADTLPDDVLYPVKIAAEQVRLSLADAPADRAAVELSIAEHRLGEAEKLAASGRTSDALVASAFYSQHIATAAAELGPEAESDLDTQLESRFTEQRERASSLAASLSTNEQSARASQVLAMIAAVPLAPGSTRVERVAESAVTLAADLASVAEAASVESEHMAVGNERAQPVATVRATPHAAQSAHTMTTPRASDAARTTREAADKARAAADKLKHAAQHKGSSGHN